MSYRWCTIATLCLLSYAFVSGEAGAATTPTSERAAQVAFSLPFVPNRGQTHPSVAFYTQAQGGSLFLTHGGEVVVALPAGGKGVRVLRERLIDGNTSQPRAGQEAPTRLSVYRGNDPSRWFANLPTYRAIRLSEVYQGIDLEMHARPGTVEKVFTVRPGADPTQIRVAVEGSSGLEIDDVGRLVLGTPAGSIRYTAPVAYQIRDGNHEDVPVTYRVEGETYSFAVGSYDLGTELVIDPLLQATYFGGMGEDLGAAVAVDPGRNLVYLAGSTRSANLPGIHPDTAQPEPAGDYDAFVAVFEPDLQTLRYATFLGGSGADSAHALVTRPPAQNEGVYVAGRTNSPDFPVVAGAAQTTSSGGGDDAFVVRLDALLFQLHAATYYGGSGDDGAVALALAADGESLYVGGSTTSDDLPRPWTGVGTIFGGWRDGFVARLDQRLVSVLNAAYLGGPGYEALGGIAVHPANGDVYAAGQTTGAFPGTAGGAQEDFGGGSDDGFVARLSAGLDTLQQSTYLGGGVPDVPDGNPADPASNPADGINAVAVGESGFVWVGGHTLSNDLPGAAGGAQTAKSGGRDGFLAMLGRDLDTLHGSTYLGGTGDDAVHALTAAGGLYVTGKTSSADFPYTAEGPQPDHGGGTYDAFLVRMGGFSLAGIGTYVGGSAGGQEAGAAVAMHPTSGDVYLAGTTDSWDLPGAAGGGQVASGGGVDAFLARYDTTIVEPTALPDILVQPNFVDFPGDVPVGDVTDAVLLSLRNHGTAPLTVTGMTFADGGHFAVDPDVGDMPCGSLTPVIPAGTLCTVGVLFRPRVEGTLDTTLTILSDDPDEPAVAVALNGTAVPEASVLLPHWTAAEVSPGAHGTDIALDAAGTPRLCYLVPTDDAGSTELHHAQRSSGDGWEKHTLLPGPEGDPLSTYYTVEAAASGGEGADCSITVDRFDIEWVASTGMVGSDGLGTSGWLSSNGTGWFITQPLDRARDVVPHGSIASSPPFGLITSYRVARDHTSTGSVIREYTPYVRSYLNDPSPVAADCSIPGDDPEPRWNSGDYAGWSDVAIAPWGEPYVSYTESAYTSLAWAESRAPWRWCFTTGDFPGRSTQLAFAADGTLHLAGLGRDGSLEYGVHEAHEGMDFDSALAADWGRWTLDFWAAGSPDPERIDYNLGMALDGDGNAHFAYYDREHRDLIYQFVDHGTTGRADLCDPAVADPCPQDLPLRWAERVDWPGQVGRSAAIAVDAEGHPHLAYLDETFESVKYAVRNPPAGAALGLAPLRWNFGTVLVGDSVAQPFFLANVGGEELRVTALRVARTDATGAAFSVSDCRSADDVGDLLAGAGLPLAAGAFRIACILYTPTDAVALTGELVIETDIGTFHSELLGRGTRDAEEADSDGGGGGSGCFVEALRNHPDPSAMPPPQAEDASALRAHPHQVQEQSGVRAFGAGSGLDQAEPSR